MRGLVRRSDALLDSSSRQARIEELKRGLARIRKLLRDAWGTLRSAPRQTDRAVIGKGRDYFHPEWELSGNPFEQVHEFSAGGRLRTRHRLPEGAGGLLRGVKRRVSS